MEINVTFEPGIVVAAVSGRFDAHGIAAFDGTVVGAVDADHTHVMIDLSQVEFMDSSAIAGLVRTLKATIAHAGSVTLVEISDAVRIILELTRLDALFPSAATMADARAHLLVLA